MEIRFPYTRIPEWCSHWSNGSSITIRPRIHDDSSRTWMGFALFVVFVIQEEEYFDDGSDLKETCFRFYADDVPLKDPLTIESFNNFKVGSYGLCVFVPKMRFGEHLNKTSHIKASFSTNRQDVKVKMCGLHVIFDQDVSKFTRDLVETSNEHLNLTSIRHCMHLLNETTKLETENDVIDLQPISHKTRREQFLGTAYPNSQQRRRLLLLFSTLFQVIFISLYVISTSYLYL